VYCMALSPDGRWLAVAAGEAPLLDPAIENKLKVLHLAQQPGAPRTFLHQDVVSLHFLADGRLVASQDRYHGREEQFIQPPDASSLTLFDLDAPPTVKADRIITVMAPRTSHVTVL